MADERVFAPGRRALTAGLVLTVTLVGFEALAVSTALPDVAADLGGLSWYGLVFTAYMLGNLLAITVAGRRADAVGPTEPFLVGLVLFAVGLVIAGVAVSMPMLVAGRLVQGLGGGAIPAVAYVCVGRGYPEGLRPRVFAVMSTAWVIPGAVGPAVSAWITGTVGWRWVFFGLLPVIVPAAAMTVPALRRLPAAIETTAEGGGAAVSDHTAGTALVLVVGVGVAFTAERIPVVAMAVAVGAIGAVVAARAFVRLVPAGTPRLAAGLPAVVGLRGVQTFTFFSIDAFVPYLFHDVRGTSLVTAGVAVTTATLLWTIGSWVQARVATTVPLRSLVASGFGLILVGSIATVLVARGWWPIPAALLGTAAAGLGMGLSYSPLSVSLLGLAPSGHEGSLSASLSLTDVLGIALGTGVAGAWVSWYDRAGVAPRTAALGLAVLPVITAAGGMAASRRLPPGTIVSPSTAPQASASA